MPTPHNVLLLAFPNGQLLDIAGPLQMFAGANDELSRRAYRMEIGAPQAGPFITSPGVQLIIEVPYAEITDQRLAHSHADHGWWRAGYATRACTRNGNRDRRQGDRSRTASVCSGTFFLAAAGALDGRRTATHWSEVGALKRFRPAVLVEGDAIHVEDRGIWTSAGVTAVDLALG